jgi:hypothetical protein
MKTAIASAQANPIAALPRAVGAEAETMTADMKTTVCRPARPTA